MNREEKKEYVIQLYKEGKSIREIAELVHMSFRDIGIMPV
jgi:predicted HTH domain antitoxin